MGAVAGATDGRAHSREPSASWQLPQGLQKILRGPSAHVLVRLRRAHHLRLPPNGLAVLSGAASERDHVLNVVFDLAMALQKSRPAPAIAPQTPDHSQARTPTHKHRAPDLSPPDPPALYTPKRIKPPALKRRTAANRSEPLPRPLRLCSPQFAAIRLCSQYRGDRLENQ